MLVLVGKNSIAEEIIKQHITTDIILSECYVFSFLS